MQKLLPSLLSRVLLGLLVLAGFGCSPQAKKERILAKADAHFAAGRYDEAEIEYKNVLQLEPLQPAALGRLGVIYYEQRRVLPAKSFLQKTSELTPDNLEVRIKLGFTNLAIRDFAGARTQALFVLDRVPTHEEAPILLVETSTNPKEIEEARQRLKQLPSPAADSAQVITAHGMLELMGKNTDAAEAAFQKAVTVNPKFVEAHAALGVIHLLKKNQALAEQEIKLAADLAPARSLRKIQYAQFKLQNNQVEAGKQMLTQMTVATPDYLPTWMMLADLASMDRKYDDALALVKKVLARDNSYPEALLMEARLLLAKGDFPQAVAELERVLKLYPSSPQFLYQLALAHVAIGDPKKAIDDLTQVMSAAPGYADAAVLLASLNMRTGNVSSAIASLRNMVQQHPEMIQPRLLLADAYRSRNTPDEALAIYAAIEKDFPGNPRTPLLQGTVLLQQKKLPEARQAFNLALTRAPDLQPAMEQLVNLDLIEKQYPAARQRVEAMIAKQPKAAPLQIMLARVFAAQKQTDEAEAALRKAIELDPESPNAYFMLAGLYLSTQQQQKALENLQQVVTANPKNTRALTLIATLQEQQKNYDQALATYEKILAIDPKSGIALNNVAVLYSERSNQLEKGFEAAQKARELYPRDPSLADTLGWIMVKKRQYAYALTLLQESAEKLSASPEIQYHLGVAHYQLGDEDSARTALEAAVQPNQPFAGIEDARKRLAVLTLATGRAGSNERKLLEAALAERPDDLIALLRLAASHEQDGAADKAIEAYQSALKASPTNVKVMLSLVRLHTVQKDLPKALEQAKAARKLAPDSTATALALGRLAYQTKDYPYAYTLLQDTARKLTDDPAVQRDLARAAYSVGRVPEADAAMKRALQLDGLSAEANEARSFLELLALGDNPTQAAGATDKIAQALKANPGNGPALMAAAAASERKVDTAATIAAYEKVLEQLPDFNPAKRRLAILYAANDGDSKKAFDLALKARAAFPDDAELAQAYGIILYRQGDFPRALTMLKESAAKRTEVAELAYYLGLTQAKLKDNAAAKKSLQRALDLKLKADLADDARKLIAELK